MCYEKVRNTKDFGSLQKTAKAFLEHCNSFTPGSNPGGALIRKSCNHHDYGIFVILRIIIKIIL